MFKLLSRLWFQLSQKRKFQFGLLFILTLIASFAEVVSIGVIVPFLGVLTSPERLFRNNTIKLFLELLNISKVEELLLPLTIIFILVAIFSGCARLLLLWFQNRFSHAVGADLSISIYRRTLYQPYQVHISRNSSEVISGIAGKANAVVYLIILPALVVFSSCIIMLAILIAILALDPVIALTAFTGFSMIYICVIYFTRNRLSTNSKRISKEEIQVIKALQEGLGGIRDVLLDGTQDVYCKVYQEADTPLRRAQANIQFIGNSPRYGIEALGMVLIAILAYFLTLRASNDVLNTIPILGALALGAQRLLPALQQGYQGWVSMKGGQASLCDALELLEQPLPSYLNKNLIPVTFEDSIELRHVSYQYASNLPLVLNNINLIIKKGSRVGFIGTTGSGKSTLLDMMLALLTPTQGQILIDGIKINQDNLRGWQSRIAHVPQSIFLADTTIAENIAFGVLKDQIDYDRVYQVANMAKISETIEKLDKKYDSFVGERGVKLSGGQRQRIGIARALYKNASIIVLDEATSALDNDTEQDVMDSIEELSDDITVLIVAHRLTTLKNCSMIVELENGEIAKVGSYKDVVK